MTTTLAELIQSRRQRGLTLGALADLSGLSSSAIHKYGAGGNRDFPPPESIRRLAVALEVTPLEIIAAAACGLGFSPARPFTLHNAAVYSMGMSDHGDFGYNERDDQAAKVTQLRQDIEFYTEILRDRMALLNEAEYELGRIDGRMGR